MDRRMDGRMDGRMVHGHRNMDLCMDEPKRPTPVRRRLSVAQAVLVKLIPMGFVLTLGM